MGDFITLFSCKKDFIKVFSLFALVLFFGFSVFAQEKNKQQNSAQPANQASIQSPAQQTAQLSAVQSDQASEKHYTELQQRENEAYKNLFSNKQDGASVQSRKGPNTAWLFIRTLFVLVLVVAAIYFIFKFVKNKTNPTDSDKDPFLKKVASLGLASGKSVQVVTLQNHCYVLGVSDDSVTLIDSLEYTSEKDKDLIDAMNFHKDSEPSDKARDFATMLATAMGIKRKSDESSSKESIFSLKDQFSRLKNNFVSAPKMHENESKDEGNLNEK